MSNIYDKYFYKIYNWALGKTRNKEDAEDITSSVFVAIQEYLNKDIEIEEYDIDDIILPVTEIHDNTKLFTNGIH